MDGNPCQRRSPLRAARRAASRTVASRGFVAVSGTAAVRGSAGRVLGAPKRVADHDARDRRVPELPRHAATAAVERDQRPARRRSVAAHGALDECAGGVVLVRKHLLTRSAWVEGLEVSVRPVNSRAVLCCAVRSQRTLPLRNASVSSCCKARVSLRACAAFFSALRAAFLPALADSERRAHQPCAGRWHPRRGGCKHNASILSRRAGDGV